MGSSSGSFRSNGSVSLMEVPTVKCKHGWAAAIDVCKRGKNYGKLVMCCPSWKNADCGFFVWVNESNDMDNAATSRLNASDVGNSVLEGKVERLKAKRNELVAEIESLKNQATNLKIERDSSRERRGLCVGCCTLAGLLCLWHCLCFGGRITSSTCNKCATLVMEAVGIMY